MYLGFSGLCCCPQAHEAVIRGQYPAPEETLQFLAALRVQYLLGDHSPHASFPELSHVFPMARLRARVHNSAKTFAPAGGSVAERSGTGERKRSSFLEGTLRRSFRSGSLSRQKLEEESSLEAWLREEAAAVRTSVMDKWKKLQGMTQEQAMVKYMTLVKEWQGHGSTLFNVEVRTDTNWIVTIFSSRKMTNCVWDYSRCIFLIWKIYRVLTSEFQQKHSDLQIPIDILEFKVRTPKSLFFVCLS